MYSELQHSNYRPEIDGLRAIAVIGVVINHAFPQILPGGFIGVDIFFVISGFLITRILLSDIQNSKFSILQFYCSRAKRILPALITMLIITTIFAGAFFSPPDFRSYAKTLISTATFTANFRFHSDSGYFEPDAKELPLLHMWSLSIEEQFYFIFPVALFIAYRFGKVGHFLLSCILISIVATEFELHKDPVTAFYFPQYRIWEFAIGGILATRSLREWQIPFRHAASLVGLMMIGLSYIFLNSNTPFPGLAALPACMGTALLICAGTTSKGGSLASTYPLIPIGLISYSLYLWHWPILAIWFYAKSGDLSTLERAAALLMAFGAAVVSWWWVEQPFRTKKSSSETKKTLILASCSLTLLIVTGLGIKAALDRHSLVVAFYGETTANLMEDTKRLVTSSKCQIIENAVSVSDCRIGNAALAPDIAIWGDSYADALKSGFSSILQERSAIGFILHSCPAILDTIRVDDRPGWRNFGPKCEEHNARVMTELAQNKNIKTVVIFSGLGSAMAPYGPNAKLIPKNMANLAKEDVRQAIADRVIETARSVERLGKGVILIGGFYAEARHGAIDLLRAYRNDTSVLENATFEKEAYDANTGPLNDYLQSNSRERIWFIDPQDLFCKPFSAVCSYYDKRALLRDSGHLTVEGARRLSIMIATVLDQNHIPR
jgi:peptidoglycan/LPS O-acetylase OafA/YrhL